MEWRKVDYKKQKGSPALTKLPEMYEEEIQDGHSFKQQQHEEGKDGGRSQHRGDQRDPSYYTPLQQRNRFAPLYTPFSKADKQDDVEGDSDEESTRSRSPRTPHKSLKPSQPAENLDKRGTQVGQALYPVPPKQASLNPLKDFPATDQPMSQQFFKDFMLSFSSFIQNNMQGNMEEIRSDMRQIAGNVALFAQETDNRVSKLEKRVADLTTAYNQVVDAHQEVMGELKWIKEKITDSEDRNRRNNVKIRGIPETVKTEALMGYVKDLIKTVLPEVTESELIVDRVHRLPKPSFIDANLPRDVILRIHFFHIKEKFLASTRRGQPLPGPFHKLTLYSDLSQATLKARKEFAPVSATLRSKGIAYSWGFPTKLRIVDGGNIHIVKDVSEGVELLRNWGIPVLKPKDSRDDRPFRISRPPRQQQKQLPMEVSHESSEEDKSAEATGTSKDTDK